MLSLLPNSLEPIEPFFALAAQISGGFLDPRVVAAAAEAVPALVLPMLEQRLRSAAHARVLDAFYAEGIAEHDLAGTSGYGYHDAAREHYESLLARIYQAEKALARLSIVSGTHAIIATLAALAPPGSRIISAVGRPYDTLRHAIASAPFSLVSQGVVYEEAALDSTEHFDRDALIRCLSSHESHRATVVFLQRSRGYATRPSLSIDEVAEIITVVRTHAPQAVIAVDNCYCELVEEREPIEVGADLVMGSLIKNLGGGIAPAGGYIAGRADLIECVAARLYAPGLGDALGPTLGFGRLFAQGLFNAPNVVWESIRGLNFAATLFDSLGYHVDPVPLARRYDIVQAIRLGSKEALEIFSRGLQLAMPINARFRPEPGAVPGYQDAVIMSSGSFVGGATIELSCDAPLREPYEVYLQGGLSAEHVVVGSLVAAHALLAADMQ